MQAETESIFELRNEGDFTQADSLDDFYTPYEVQEMARKSVADLDAGVANLRVEGVQEFQQVYNLISSVVGAFRAGATYEAIVDGAREGWKRARQDIVREG